MANVEIGIEDETREAAAANWFDFLLLVDPLRPGLFRYCRRLTGNLWDAEDLVQDTLERGFAKLASVHHTVTSPRAYLLRIASNLWVDRTRRLRAESVAVAYAASDPTRGTSESPAASIGVEVREAGAALLRDLAPRERAAVLLKDVFDLSIGETAEILGTTIGAVKAALHRGRNRLSESSETPRPAPREAVVDRFVERYNARDLAGLVHLMLDGASIEMYGHVYEAGREVFERKGGWFDHNFTNPFDGSASDAVWEVADFRGEPIVLVLYGADDERVVGSVMRFEVVDERIARIRVYALCPDVIEEVATELRRPVSPLRMYRFPIRA